MVWGYLTQILLSPLWNTWTQICQWALHSNTATRLEKLLKNFVNKFVQLISLFHTNKLIDNFAIFQGNYSWYRHHLQLKNKTSNNQTLKTQKRKNKVWLITSVSIFTFYKSLHSSIKQFNFSIMSPNNL